MWEQITITQDTDLQEVLDRIGFGDAEELRSSDRRRRGLEKYSKMMTGVMDLTLVLREPAGSSARGPARCTERDDGSMFIEVTDEPPEQRRTDLDQAIYDYLFQKGLTIHEIGHILYTDFPRFKQFLVDAFPDFDWDDRTIKNAMNVPPEAKLAMTLFNILEDGAINRQLSSEFRVRDALNLVYYNMTEGDLTTSVESKEIRGEPTSVYGLVHALQAATFDIAVWETGLTKQILEMEHEDRDDVIFIDDDTPRMIREFIPRIDQVTMEMQSEPDGTRRIDLFEEFWEDVLDLIEDSNGAGWEMNQTIDVVVLSPGGQGVENTGGQRETARALAEADEIIIDPEGDLNGDTPLGGSPGQEVKRAAQKRIEQMEEECSVDGEAEITGQVQDELRREMEELLGPGFIEELQNVQQAIGAGDAEIDEIIIPERRNADAEIQARSVQNGKRIGKMLMRRLRQQRKSHTVRNQRYGRFDPRRMMPATMGKTDVFTRKVEPREKNYSCIIVADRSGSMGGDDAELVEAIGSMCYGLESVNIDTCVLDILNNQLRLAKPFSTKTDDWSQVLFDRSVGGGTPLRTALAFARHRVNLGSGDYPFVIVITDGKPARREEYQRQLAACTFPVLGIYLRNDNGSSVAEDFDFMHRHTVANGTEDLQRKLYGLVSEVIF